MVAVVPSGREGATSELDGPEESRGQMQTCAREVAVAVAVADEEEREEKNCCRSGTHTKNGQQLSNCTCCSLGHLRCEFIIDFRRKRKEIYDARAVKAAEDGRASAFSRPEPNRDLANCARWRARTSASPTERRHLEIGAKFKLKLIHESRKEQTLHLIRP